AFQVISERYDYRRSTAITTNRPFKEWPKVFPDPLNAQVIAERLAERCEHFVLTKGFRIQKSSKHLPSSTPTRPLELGFSPRAAAPPRADAPVRPPPPSSSPGHR